MKTKLPTAITTIEEAKAFLKELNSNCEAFHPEDDAEDIGDWLGINDDAESPTAEECKQLNKLLKDIFYLEGNVAPFFETDGYKCWDGMKFDPCGYLLDLGHEEERYFVRDLSGRDGHYETRYTDLRDDENFNDDEEFLDWLNSNEEGDEYTEFNNVKITRIMRG